MHCQSATSPLTRPLTVAAEVFAPGHLGELTKYLPIELVDAVLTATGTVQRRVRSLPSRVGVYFLLALGLFPHLGYAKVWDKLVAGLTGLTVPAPSEKALRDLRRRLGTAPVKALFEIVPGPLAQPRTPGVRYRRWRTVAFDGCSSVMVPDAERNRGHFGRNRNRHGWNGYPLLRLMTLVETGSRGLLGAVFGPTRHGENHYAQRLLHLLGPDMLVLADRGFDDGKFLAQVARHRRAVPGPPHLSSAPADGGPAAGRRVGRDRVRPDHVAEQTSSHPAAAAAGGNSGQSGQPLKSFSASGWELPSRTTCSTYPLCTDVQTAVRSRRLSVVIRGRPTGRVTPAAGASRVACRIPSARLAQRRDPWRPRSKGSRRDRS
ncbi:transposase domain-containing protein [Streptomyces sp. NPDC001834]|uniref:transposase domain-containing protein n=1 Tax=Streptomyces sp. NPDC001834 TaxID=3364616 RepID=UPI0036BE19E9